MALFFEGGAGVAGEVQSGGCVVRGGNGVGDWGFEALPARRRAALRHVGVPVGRRGGAGRLAGLSEQAEDINAAPPEGLIDRSSYFRGCELRVRRCKLCE